MTNRTLSVFSIDYWNHYFVGTIVSDILQDNITSTICPINTELNHHMYMYNRLLLCHDITLILIFNPWSFDSVTVAKPQKTNLVKTMIAKTMLFLNHLRTVFTLILSITSQNFSCRSWAPICGNSTGLITAISNLC